MRGSRISDMHVTGPSKATAPAPTPATPGGSLSLFGFNDKFLCLMRIAAYLLAMFMIEHPVYSQLICQVKSFKDQRLLLV